jgi:Kelch motif/Galactose oxidase, central domain
MAPLHRLGLAGLLLLLACEAPTPPSGAGGVALQVQTTFPGLRVLDSGVVRLEGPTALRRSVVPGTQVTIEQLEPGSYTVSLEGFVAQEVQHFGRTTGIQVVAGTDTPASLNFGSFAPVMDNLAATMTSRTFAVGFTGGTGAVRYQIETATNPGFTANRDSSSTTQSPGSVTVPNDGTYYVRVRAFDPFQGRGQPSMAQSVEVIAQQGLAFQVQPSDVVQGAVISPPVQVRARDALGNTVTAFTGNVTVALGNNAGGAILSGTTTVPAAAGVATFSNLSVDKIGTGYTLVASATSLTGATSSTFNVACSNCWLAGFPVMPTSRELLGAGVVNGVLYAIGGMDAFGQILTTVEAYDPATNGWTPKASLPSPRRRFGVGVVNGLLYVVGGEPTNGIMTSAVDAYDPTANTWTSKASLPTGRSGLAVGVVNGLLYAVGGFNVNGDSSSVVVYDPASNIWAARASLGVGRSGLAVGVVNGTLYAVGGNAGSDTLTTVEAYNPATNTWTSRASTTTQHRGLGVGVVNGLLYAVGGGASGAVDAYNPTTNSWTARASMPTPRNNLGIGVISGLLHAVGGTGQSPAGQAHEVYQP